MNHVHMKGIGLFIVLILFITGFGSGLAQSEKNKSMPTHSLIGPSHHTSPIKFTREKSPIDGEDITGGDYNESHPSLAANSNQDLFAAYEGTTDGSAYYPIFANSTDWTNGMYFQEAAGCGYPQVDYKTGGFYGTFQPSPDTSGQIWIVDATDPTYPTGEYWDFSQNNFNTFQDFKIGTYTHAGPTDDGSWNWGGLAFVGYNGYNGANIQGCPFIFYQTDSGGNGVIDWLQGQVSGCTHTAMDIDLVKNMSYSVYQRNTGTYDGLIVRKDDFGKWTNQGSYYAHPKVTTITINDAAGNIRNPDIVANNNTILLVAQDDASGTNNIVCYRSMNGFQNYTTVTITNSGDNLYPKIAFADKKDVLCTYLKGTHIYYKTSQDAGATWGEEVSQNWDDNVVSEYGAADLCPAGTDYYTIWQDSRGANRDIYYNDFYSHGPDPLKLTIKGGLGKVKVTILNPNTYYSAPDITWTISVKGGIFNLINKKTYGYTNTTLGPGQSIEVETDGELFGLGRIIIRVDVDAWFLSTSTSALGYQFFFLTKVKY